MAATATAAANSAAFNGSSSKMIHPCLLGCVNIQLDENLMNRGLCESWHTLEIPPQQAQTTNTPAGLLDGLSSQVAHCSIRVKIRFCQETVHLNEGVYYRLSEFLLDERQHKHLCQVYDQVVPSTERTHLVHALLRYFIVKDRILAALKSFLSAEIDRCADLATLFRPATLCTSLMDQYMRVR